MKKKVAWLVLIAFVILGTVGFAEPKIPPVPTSSFYVQDYAGVLTVDTKNRINSLGSQLAAKTKAQVVVVTVKTLEGTPSSEYALAVLRTWGIGDKTLNNGLVMLIAVSDRQSRIEVGYGLEGALPDAKTGRIQDMYMVPYFQKGDYDKGILNGYLALVDEVAKEYKLELKAETKPVAPPSVSAESWWDQLPWWMQILIIVCGLLLLVIDWMFFGGRITFLILSMFRGGRGGGSSGGGYGGGSGGGGGSSRRW